MAAMRHAVADMLARLSPEVLRPRSDRSDRAIPSPDVQRKARAWDAFEIQYGQLRKGLNEDFDQTLGEAFTAAYNELVRNGGRASRSPTSGKERM
jgi:predicted component of type VI protein secretion system